MSREEAEEDLSRIRETVGTGTTPDVAWLAATGEDILAASLVQTGG